MGVKDERDSPLEWITKRTSIDDRDLAYVLIESEKRRLEIDRLTAQVATLTEALEWYGMQMTYEYIKDESAPILADRGTKALQALANTDTTKDV